MNTKICPLCKAPIPTNAPGGLCPACVLRDAEEPAPIGHAAPSLEEISAAFPHLEVLRLIGQGGMGFVYQARQPSLDRTVALKILAPELGRDPAFAERFAREARVLGKLSHPNIVTVFEHGESGGFFYLLMEYVDGVNLRQAMRAGRFTPQQALAVVPGICDALQAAHAQGVWHRDIKPENILLDARGGVKIADFGIARIVGDPARDFTLTATGGALGSAAYMAPEQHEKPHDVDHRADIYSLGVVIYEMLTGELPLGRFPAPSQRAAVSARIDEIVFQSLEKERELRQQSAAEVKTEVSQAAKHVEPAASPEVFTTPSPLRVSLMAAIGGAALIAFVGLYTSGSDRSTFLHVGIFPLAVGLAGLLVFQRSSQPAEGERRIAKWLAVAILLVTGLVAAVAYYGQLSREYAARHRLAAAIQPATGVAPGTGAPPTDRPTRINPPRAANVARLRPPDGPGAAKIAPPVSAEPKIPAAEVLSGTAAKPEMDSTIPRGGATPLETILRLNDLANANDKEGFKRYLAMNVPPAEVDGYVAERLDVFTGKIVGVWRTGAEKRLGAQLDLSAPHPMYWFEREREGKRVFIQCFISVDKGRCLNFSQMSAPYRATARIEFRPTEGDPLRILRGVLPENSAFEVEQFFANAAPVAGQFNARSYEVPTAEVAAAKANELTQMIGEKLKALGQDSKYRVIKAATAPERPNFFTMPNLEQLFPEPAKSVQ